MRPFSVLNENAQPRSYIEQLVISPNIFRYNYPPDSVLAGDPLCKEGVQLHFDIAQKNTIIWSSEEEISERLQTRIVATIE